MAIRKHPLEPPYIKSTVLSALLLAAGITRAEPVEVRLTAGSVIAAPSSDYLILKGIPYAAAPTGARRWQVPQAVESWTQPRAAGAFGPSCPQPESPRYVTPGTAAASTSEDCLFLNVWAPKSTVKPLPVVVWIHGGGNVSGTASQTFYDGSAFARDGIVFVSFNYRLGVLGFFAHPSLMRGPGAANFGLLDQIAALRWIRSNISAVGGDPNNVTVMGESAGAEDVLALMCVAAARGLFARAIVESAGMGWGSPPTLEDAEAEGAAVATALGLEGIKASAAELRAAPVAAIVQAQSGHELGPILDRTTLLSAPLGVFRARAAVHIPLLIGTNDNEATMVSSEPTVPAAPAALFPRLTSVDLAALRGLYGAAAADDVAFSRLLIRDGFFAAPARTIAGANSHDAPTFLYRFDYVSSVFHGRRTGAAHGSEIPFVFQTGLSSQAADIDSSVSSQIHGYWTSFIRAGVPTYGDTVWPAYDTARDETLVFAQSPHVMKTPEAAALDLLRSRLLDP